MKTTLQYITLFVLGVAVYWAMRGSLKLNLVLLSAVLLWAIRDDRPKLR